MAPTRADIEMSDPNEIALKEEQMMYGHGPQSEQELNQNFPRRPHNHAGTLFFHELFTTFFNPLNDNRKKATGPAIARKKLGPHGPGHAPHEVRRSIIERFISRWRREVGNDIYPAFRLIIPEKDRDRGMYGLKEVTLGKLLVRIMKIDKNSEDGYNILHWKLPGMKASSSMAGDFAGRCYEVLSKRPMRSTPGDMTIAEVNELLDRLSGAQKEENQLPIMEVFYRRMNAEELMWLIRMILRQMKIGATERTLFDIWHPDAENLFNISSSLRRVCWELYDPQVRLEGDDRGLALMQCFQPQLAAFQMRTMEIMVSKMHPTEEDPVFWIEEKLDGERMQLHMTDDPEVPGGKRFGFWSRKAKDYTYLYGNGFDDPNGSLTRHIRDAFDDGVRSIILDGEMITWDPKEDAIVPFGHLKTAALSEQQNPFAGGNRPLFRVFDCVFLNNVDLTRYTLRKRREALEASVKTIHRRLEVHSYVEARQASEIEPVLRQVIAEASEGLVLKNPRSEYRLNDRNDDWIKVKPEYMTEFGESLDCIVIGGYFGSGKRGGSLSSFLCGLRIGKNDQDRGVNPQKCFSFFKVGGGFTADDYAQVRHLTEGKWTKWDSRKPPTDWIELGGGDRQHEKPDVWIKPECSVVLSVKAASISSTSQFRTGLTLRFPRFKNLRSDKDWTQALSLDEFFDLKNQVEHAQEEKQLEVDNQRRARKSRKRKQAVVIQGQEGDQNARLYAGPSTKALEGLSFYIMSEASKPLNKSKADLEQIVKSNGGTVVASEKDPNTILIADRNLVKVSSIVKRGQRNILRPSWLLDCVKQNEIDLGRPTLRLPYEPKHLFFTTFDDRGKYDDNVDEFGDSYTRDLTPAELLALCDAMPSELDHFQAGTEFLEHLPDHEREELEELPGWTFHGLTAYFDHLPHSVVRQFEFAGGTVADSLHDKSLTHVVVAIGSKSVEVRKEVSTRKRLPRIVTSDWVMESCRAETRLDEERFACI